MRNLNFILEAISLQDFKVFNNAINYLKINTEDTFDNYLSKLDYKTLNLNRDLSKWSKEDITFFVYEVVNEDYHNKPFFTPSLLTN